jgi:hypothetical protein
MKYFMTESQIKESIDFNTQNIQEHMDYIDQIEKQLLQDMKGKKKYTSSDIQYFQKSIKDHKENIEDFKRLIKARNKQLEHALSVEDAFNEVDREADQEEQLELFELAI